MIRQAVALCLLSSLSCSVFFVTPPQSRSRDEYPHCSTSPAGSVFDVLLAGGAFYIAHDASESDFDDDNDDAETFAIFGALYAASAIYGAWNTWRCIGQKRAFEVPEPYQFGLDDEPEIDAGAGADAGPATDAGVDAGGVPDAEPTPRPAFGP